MLHYNNNKHAHIYTNGHTHVCVHMYTNTLIFAHLESHDVLQLELMGIY